MYTDYHLAGINLIRDVDLNRSHYHVRLMHKCGYCPLTGSSCPPSVHSPFGTHVNPQIPLVNLEYWYTWHSNHRAFSLIDGFDTVQWDIIIENKFHLTNGDIQSDPHFL